MAGRSIAAALVLLCASAASALTVDDIRPHSVYTVRAIRIEGNSRVSGRALRTVMLTQVPPWYAPWRRKPVFNPASFRTDLERIRTLLRESGYFQAEVTHELEVEGDSLTIVLHVHEGPPAKVADVATVWADFTPDAAEERAVRRTLTIAPGAVFTQEAYDESRRRLERFYLERSFAYARVDKAAIVDTATDSVNVTYRVQRGRSAVFGETRISGTRNVAPRLIMRELAYERGDPYDPRKIEQTQANVFGLRLFRSVVVEPANLPAQSGVVDVAIPVVEGPPREVRAGIGYGLEDEVRGELRWQHNDFFGGGRQLGFRLKGSSITQAFEGEFRQPHFLHRQQTFVLPLTQARDDEPGFTVERIRLAPRIERKLRPDLKLSLGYNVEYDDLTDVPDATVARLDEFEKQGFVSGFAVGVERSTADDLLDPKTGSVLRFDGEQAGGVWAGDYTFYRAIAEAKKYLPLPGDRRLAGRVRIGGGDGFGQSRDLPMFRRLFSGGINSTRGYGRSLVGPLNEFGSPVGGRSLLEANLEFRTPIYKQLGGVVFFDVGEVRRQPFSYTAGDLKYGTGFGIRYRTIVGPLRLDLGFPLQPPPGEPHWRIHFSVGQAF